MPTNAVKTKADEEKWNKAKGLAKKAGHKDNYAYIRGIYNKMVGESKFNKKYSEIMEAFKGPSNENILNNIIKYEVKDFSYPVNLPDNLTSNVRNKIIRDIIQKIVGRIKITNGLVDEDLNIEENYKSNILNEFMILIPFKGYAVRCVIYFLLYKDYIKITTEDLYGDNALTFVYERDAIGPNIPYKNGVITSNHIKEVIEFWIKENYSTKENLQESISRQEWNNIDEKNIIRKFAELMDVYDEELVKQKLEHAQLVAQKIGKEHDWASIKNITAKSLGIPVPSPTKYINITKNNANSYTIKLDTKHIDFLNREQLIRLFDEFGSKLKVNNIDKQKRGFTFSIEADQELIDKIDELVAQSKIDPQQSLPGF